MPHSKAIPLVCILFLFKVYYSSSTFAQEQNFHLEKKSLYLPSVDSKNQIEGKTIDFCQKNTCLQFIKYNSATYLKVIFSKEKDTVKTAPVEKYRTEVEIKSGTKVYYKKEWNIYHENNQLFFVLLLPPNYIKTLATEGITEILASNTNIVSFSKKENRQIKEIADFLLNN